MKIGITISIAYHALGRNRTRTALTMLGIIIGVAAVIIMVGVGQGAKQSIETQIASMGTNMIVVLPGSMKSGGMRMGFGSVQTLVPSDVDAIIRECPSVLYASPMVNAAAQVVYKNQNWNTTLNGVSPSFLSIRDWQLSAGNVFTDNDVKSASKVCLLGYDVASSLFGNELPIGKTIRIQKIPFRVIGVLVARGKSGMGRSQDDVILMPYTTLMKRILNQSYISLAFVSAISQNQMKDAQAEIAVLLRQRHRIKPGADDDFSIGSQADITAMATSTSTTLTILLGSVASISLIVGGIGIMNIMLVSVRERTREIGIRMAVGAKNRDILLQFLIEAIVLSALGGFIGIILGVTGGMLISRYAQLPTVISPISILISIGFAAGIGIFFGFYPARTAARLNPIEALRYE
ncbi:MAG: ABC transporter permease [bacterium]|nr:ABC transporter permease [bacterium]